MSMERKQCFHFLQARLLILLSLLWGSGQADSSFSYASTQTTPRKFSNSRPQPLQQQLSIIRSGQSNRFRGGSQDSHHPEELKMKGVEDNNEDLQVAKKEEDEERYSRQVYALGHRAHGLIRSSTVYLDGPSDSGLVYEIAKNLALSGIRRLVLVVPSSMTEKDYNNPYHNPSLDDLGVAYVRAATLETQDSETLSDLPGILLEYVKRLNPSVLVERCVAEDLAFDSTAVSSDTNDRDGSVKRHGSMHQNSDDNGPLVYMAIDRPQSSCEQLNEWVRQQKRHTQTSDDSENHSPEPAFVAVETAGIYGRIFTDFGSEFVVDDADGEPAALTPLLQVTEDVADDDGKVCYHVHCMPGEKHDLSQGDELQFHLRNGDCLDVQWSCTVERVKSPYLVRVAFNSPNAGKDPVDNSMTPMVEEINQAQPVAFSRIKKPLKLSFIPLQRALRLQEIGGHDTSSASLVTPADLGKSMDTKRQQVLFSCFSALDRFVQEQERLPLSSDKDQNFFVPVGDFDMETSEAQSIVPNFVRSCAAKLTPLQGIMGAVAAQEALKAVSGLYTPIHQFLFFDCEELLYKEGDYKQSQIEKITLNDSKETQNTVHANGLRFILGDEVVQTLQSRKLFIAGAGAIGCELLKNLAAMGAATSASGKGKLILTDMDTIEKSNLSRQLLFRDSDLGHFKSLAAKRGTLLFNPNCLIEAHSCKVGKRQDKKSSGGNVFEDDENFWSRQVDIVLNALDNVDARLYMDGQCVKYHKALVDAGTMGPKGNVQVVVPGFSESYASSADPPEEAIPVCTLKSFPYAIAHTIQWSRDLFDGLFVKRAQQANDFSNALQKEEETGTQGGDTGAHRTAISHMADKLLHESGEHAALVTVLELEEDLMAAETATDAHSIRDHSLKWAASLARKLYVESVDQLLRQHPLDSKDEDGEEFWSGTRKPPSRLFLDPSEKVSGEQESINQNLISFVRHGARLRAESFVSSGTVDVFFTSEQARDALTASFKNPPSSNDGEVYENVHVLRRDQVLDRLLAIPVGTKAHLNVADFEKDDDSNGHVAFLTAASNLRAISYGIPSVDAMETRRVAGRIIPAMITTTALVSALSCIELIKLVQGAPLHQHRNAFVNLALPFFAFTPPLPAEPSPGLSGREYTLWDKLFIAETAKMAASKSGGMNVKSLLKQIRKLAKPEDSETVEVLSVSLGPYLLYANFLHQEDEDLLNSSIWKVIEEALESEEENDTHERATSDTVEVSSDHFSPDDKAFDLLVIVEDVTTGEEVELPPIRLGRFQRP